MLTKTRSIGGAIICAALLLGGCRWRPPPVSVEVLTSLPGASPQEVEAQVTVPIERALLSLEHRTDVRSTSSEGQSSVVVSIEGADPFLASTMVQQKVQAVMENIPRQLGVLPPMVLHRDDRPAALLVVLTAPGFTMADLTALADRSVAIEAERQVGVASADLVGEVRRQLRVTLSPERLAATGISPDQVRSALSGRPASDFRFLVRPPFPAVDMVAGLDLGRGVRLRDIAAVVSGVEPAVSLAYLQGKPAVLVEVRAQFGAPLRATARAVQSRLASVSLPSGVERAFFEGDDPARLTLRLQGAAGISLDDAARVARKVSLDSGAVLALVKKDSGGAISLELIYPAGVKPPAIGEPGFARSAGPGALRVAVSGDDEERILAEAETLARKIGPAPGVTAVSVGTRRMPRIRYRIDRDRAADLAVSREGVAESLLLATTGEAITYYSGGSTLWLRIGSETAPLALPGLDLVQVPGRNSARVPLSELVVATAEECLEPIERRDGRREVTVAVEADPGRLKVVARALDDLVAKQPLGLGERIERLPALAQ